MEINEFTKLEQFIGDEIPKSLKILLQACGYDSLLSLKQISTDKIDELEEFIQIRWEKFVCKLDEMGQEMGNEIDDGSAAEYMKQECFVFLPGHRTILSSLPRQIKEMQSTHQSFVNSGPDLVNKRSAIYEQPREQQVEYSHILSQMIITANMNKNQPKQANRYPDDIKYFSTYIYLLCGRTCYETLTTNLPIPSTKTVREYD